MFVPASCLQKAHGDVDSSQLQLCRARAAASRAGIKQCSSSWEGAAEKTTAGRMSAGAAEECLPIRMPCSFGAVAACVYVLYAGSSIGFCQSVGLCVPFVIHLLLTGHDWPRKDGCPGCCGVYQAACLNGACQCVARQHEPAWAACGHGEAWRSLWRQQVKRQWTWQVGFKSVAYVHGAVCHVSGPFATCCRSLSRVSCCVCMA